jgi:hypothetical protein
VKWWHGLKWLPLLSVKKTIGVSEMVACKKVSIKKITEDCEKTTLYPEENCGYPTTIEECEDAPENKLKTDEKKKKKEKVVYTCGMFSSLY